MSNNTNNAFIQLVEIDTTNCLWMDCGGCVNDECASQVKNECKRDNKPCANYEFDGVIQPSNIGKNANKMLQIGLAQDAIESLGFKLDTIVPIRAMSSFCDSKSNRITFYGDKARFNNKDFYYDNINWQMNLVNAISWVQNV